MELRNDHAERLKNDDLTIKDIKKFHAAFTAQIEAIPDEEFLSPEGKENVVRSLTYIINNLIGVQSNVGWNQGPGGMGRSGNFELFALDGAIETVGQLEKKKDGTVAAIVETSSKYWNGSYMQHFSDPRKNTTEEFSKLIGTAWDSAIASMRSPQREGPK